MKTILCTLLVVSVSAGATLLRSKTQDRFKACGNIFCDSLYEVCTIIADPNDFRCICKEEGKEPPLCAPGPSFHPSNTSAMSLSEEPSYNPSLTPSDGSSQRCFLGITTQCTNSDGSEACDSLLLHTTTRCDSRPFALMFRYHGGSCINNRDDSPPASFVECQDNSNGGPPTTEGQLAFIVATSRFGVVYHSKYVAVGSDFMVGGGRTGIDDIVTVMVYSSSTTSNENLLQTITYTSDCSSDLSLMDNFGSIQVLLFASQEQGVVSYFFGATYTFAVENMGTESSATLSSLFTITSLGTFDLDHMVNGVVVAPGTTASFQKHVFLDLTAQQRYSSLSVVTAEYPEGHSCSSQDMMSFVVGAPYNSAPGPASPTGPMNVLSSEKCFLHVEMKCAPSDSSEESCDDIQPVVTGCVDRPFAMAFRYNGGDCSNTVLQDEDSLIVCMDYNTRPPSIEGELSYIVVSDISDSETIYHAAFVPVGSEFVVQFGPSGAAAVMSIRIYSSAEAVPANMLQSLDVMSDCSQSTLYLKDQFGSVQLLVFANEAQGVMTCFKSVTYSFAIENVGRNSTTTLSSLSSITTLGVVDLIDNVNGVVVAPGATVQFQHELLLDVTDRQRYSALTTITAGSPDGQSCTAKAMMTYVVGNTPNTSAPVTGPLPYGGLVGPPPLSSPTTPPSDMNVTTPEPTDAPHAAHPSDKCFVDIKVVCIPSDGSGDCNDIEPIEARCNQRPLDMLFRYNGGACSQFSNEEPDSLVQCLDFNSGPPAVNGQISYIKVTDVDDVALVYHEGFVAVGESFMLNGQVSCMDSTTNVVIYSSADTSRSNLLQSVVYHSDCRENLFLKDRLGSIQLLSFTNSAQGIMSVFFRATYSFTVENVGSATSTTLTNMNTITSLGVFEVPVDGVVLAPGESVSYEQEVVLDLTKQQRYGALSTVTGTSPGGHMCTDKDLYTFWAPLTVVVDGPSFLAPSVRDFPTQAPVVL